MRKVILAIAALVLSAVPAVAASIINDDNGGQIGPYLAKYRALTAAGERVEIDGSCASACTLVLGIVPRNHICVTSRASLQFHSAWDAEGDRRVAADGSRILWSNYPADVRAWITRHGGLSSRILTLRGSELASMFPTCR
jgi:hypothetical protein